MIYFNFRFALVLIISNLYFLFSVFAQKTDKQGIIYDGNIGSDKIILVAESEDSDFMKGYFVLNRGKAVEEVYPFSIDFSGSKPFFQSAMFVGPLKQTFRDSSEWSGTMKLMNKKKRFLFFRPKADFELALRPAVNAKPTERYQAEVFDSIEVKPNILYGKAKGYWTRSPYSDDPYIVTLGKGLIKTFKDHELLDLKLDLYFFKNRFVEKAACCNADSWRSFLYRQQRIGF
jgi:hypothetical protein